MTLNSPSKDAPEGKTFAYNYSMYDEKSKDMTSGYLPLDPRGYNSFTALRGGNFNLCLVDKTTSASGTIRDADNKPVNGATVSLRSLTSATTEGDVLQTVTTGDDGTYSFSDVDAGYLYCINVTKDGYTESDEHPYIVDNDVNDYNIRQGDAYLKGVVKDSLAQPVTDVDIVATANDGSTIKATLDNNGNFQLDGLKLEEYILTLDSDDYYFKQTINITKSSDESLSPYIAYKKISVAVESQGEGKVINEDTGEVIDSIDYYIGSTQLRRDDAHPEYIGVQNPEETIKMKAVANDGATFYRFDIDNVDDYKIVAYFSEAESSLYLAGKVLNTSNEPVAGATVTLTTTEPKVYTATTDDNGQYKLTDIAKGASGSFVID
jgi:hypothetical protein